MWRGRTKLDGYGYRSTTVSVAGVGRVRQGCGARPEGETLVTTRWRASAAGTHPSAPLRSSLAPREPLRGCVPTAPVSQASLTNTPWSGAFVRVALTDYWPVVLA